MNQTPNIRINQYNDKSKYVNDDEQGSQYVLQRSHKISVYSSANYF